MARRVPPWVVIVAFAVVMGGAIGGFAYLRGRSHAAEFCEARQPHVTHRETARVSRRGFCEVRYGTALVVTRTKPGDFEARRRALGAERLSLAPATPASSMRLAWFRTTVQATAPSLVALVARDDDVVELHFDPRIYTEDQALVVIREVAARFR